MKSIKKILLPFISLPLVATPFAMTSCSVYKDVKKKGYNVDYSPRTGEKITTDIAEEYWNSMLSSHNRFLEQEIYKNADLVSHTKFAAIPIEGHTKITYSVEYTSFQIFVKYAKYTKDGSIYRLSFKYLAEIEEKNNWYYTKDGSEPTHLGYGIDHYTVDWEVQNLQYKIFEEKEDYRRIGEKHKFYIAPKKLEASKFAALEGNEKIIFNLRELIEIYGKNGIQSYGSESKEAGTIDKDNNYIPTMQKMISNICSFYSYYLWDCWETD